LYEYSDYDQVAPHFAGRRASSGGFGPDNATYLDAALVIIADDDRQHDDGILDDNNDHAIDRFYNDDDDRRDGSDDRYDVEWIGFDRCVNGYAEEKEEKGKAAALIRGANMIPVRCFARGSNALSRRMDRGR
jgi:hypothetical protein